MNISKAVREALVQREVDKQVTRLLEVIDGYGPDREDGTVLRFSKALPIQSWVPGQVVSAAQLNEVVAGQFADDGTAVRRYTYVALRAAGRWYLTGPTHAGVSYDWDELRLWLADGPEPVTELTELVPKTS